MVHQCNARRRRRNRRSSDTRIELIIALLIAFAILLGFSRCIDIVSPWYDDLRDAFTNSYRE